MAQMLVDDPRYPGSMDQARLIIRNIGNPSVNENDMGCVIREWVAADEASQAAEGPSPEVVAEGIAILKAELESPEMKKLILGENEN